MQSQINMEALPPVLPSSGLPPSQCPLAFWAHPLPPVSCIRDVLSPVDQSCCLYYSSLFVYKKIFGSCWPLDLVPHLLPSRSINPQEQLVLCSFPPSHQHSLMPPLISFLFPLFYWKCSPQMQTMITKMLAPTPSSQPSDYWNVVLCHSHLLGTFLLCFGIWFLLILNLWPFIFYSSLSLPSLWCQYLPAFYPQPSLNYLPWL